MPDTINQMRKTFRANMRNQNQPCWICGQPIDYEADPNGTSPDRFHLDHYYPVSTYPELKLDPANFRPSHAQCNQARGNKAPHPGLGKPSQNW